MRSAMMAKSRAIPPLSSPSHSRNASRSSSATTTTTTTTERRERDEMKRERSGKNKDRKSASSRGDSASADNFEKRLISKMNDFEAVALDLTQKKLKRIPDLSQHAKVTSLDLSCNLLMKIEKVDGLQNLQELMLYSNHIVVLENLDRLKKLTCLYLQNNSITVIGKGLSCLKSLTTLRLDGNRISSIQPSELSGCAKLTSIDLSSNHIEDLSALNYLPQLEELICRHNGVKIIPDLSRCGKLMDVDLHDNEIVSLSGLKGLTNLRKLVVSSNRVQDLRFLSRQKNLLDLDASNNLISELSYFPEQFPSLEVLDLSGNQISDEEQLLALTGCCFLVEVDVQNNPIQQTGPEWVHALRGGWEDLEMFNGTCVKRFSTGRETPVTRPMATALTVQQIEQQLNEMEASMQRLSSTLPQRFSAIQEALPEFNTDLLVISPRPTSRGGRRSRLQEAKMFAENYYGPDPSGSAAERSRRKTASQS